MVYKSSFSMSENDEISDRFVHIKIFDSSIF